MSRICEQKRSPMLSEALSYVFTHNKHPTIGSRAYKYCSNAFSSCDCNNHAVSCSLNREIDWIWYMATGKKQGRSNKPVFGGIEFVQYSLSADDKKNFLLWQKKSDGQLDNLVIEVLQTNQKIGFSFN